MRTSGLETVFGSPEGEFLAIGVRRRPYADPANLSDDAYDWDANWVTCLLEAKLRGFRASFDVHLQTSDFPPFRDALRRLWNELLGEATFTTIEEQLALRVRGDGVVHMTMSGELRDIAGTGNRLQFKLELDQTHLTSSLRQLDDLIDRFPVLSRR